MHRQIDLNTPTVYRIITREIRHGQPLPLHVLGGPYVDLGVAKRVLSKDRNEWEAEVLRLPDYYREWDREWYIEESPLVWTRVT